MSKFNELVEKNLNEGVDNKKLAKSLSKISDKIDDLMNDLLSLRSADNYPAADSFIAGAEGHLSEAIDAIDEAKAELKSAK